MRINVTVQVGRTSSAPNILPSFQFWIRFFDFAIQIFHGQQIFEYQTSPVFKWSKADQSVKCPEFEQLRHFQVDAKSTPSYSSDLHFSGLHYRPERGTLICSKIYGGNINKEEFNLDIEHKHFRYIVITIQTISLTRIRTWDLQSNPT